MHTPMPSSSLKSPRMQSFKQQLGGKQQQPKPPAKSQLNLSANTLRKGQLPPTGLSTA